MTRRKLAEKTGTAERYVREWLNAQARRGFVTRDAAQRYQAARGAGQAAFAGIEGQPRFFVVVVFELATATLRAGADLGDLPGDRLRIWWQ